MTLATAADQAARATGLPKTTCMTLLEAGWTLKLDIAEPTRWLAPEVQYVDLPVSFAPGAIVIESPGDPREIAQQVIDSIEQVAQSGKPVAL